MPADHDAAEPGAHHPAPPDAAAAPEASAAGAPDAAQGAGGDPARAQDGEDDPARAESRDPDGGGAHDAADAAHAADAHDAARDAAPAQGEIPAPPAEPQPPAGAGVAAARDDAGGPDLDAHHQHRDPAESAKSRPSPPRSSSPAPSSPPPAPPKTSRATAASADREDRAPEDLREAAQRPEPFEERPQTPEAPEKSTRPTAAATAAAPTTARPAGTPTAAHAQTELEADPKPVDAAFASETTAENPRAATAAATGAPTDPVGAKASSLAQGGVRPAEDPKQSEANAPEQSKPPAEPGAPGRDKSEPVRQSEIANDKADEPVRPSTSAHVETAASAKTGESLQHPEPSEPVHPDEPVKPSVHTPTRQAEPVPPKEPAAEHARFENSAEPSEPAQVETPAKPREANEAIKPSEPEPAQPGESVQNKNPSAPSDTATVDQAPAAENETPAAPGGSSTSYGAPESASTQAAPSASQSSAGVSQAPEIVSSGSAAGVASVGGVGAASAAAAPPPPSYASLRARKKSQEESHATPAPTSTVQEPGTTAASVQASESHQDQDQAAEAPESGGPEAPPAPALSQASKVPESQATEAPEFQAAKAPESQAIKAPESQQAAKAPEPQATAEAPEPQAITEAPEPQATTEAPESQAKEAQAASEPEASRVEAEGEAMDRLTSSEMASPLDDWGSLGVESPKAGDRLGAGRSSAELEASRASPEPVDMASEMGAQYMAEDPAHFDPHGSPEADPAAQPDAFAPESERSEEDPAAEAAPARDEGSSSPETANPLPSESASDKAPETELEAHEMLDQPPQSLLLLPENPPRLLQTDGSLMSEVHLPDDELKSPQGEATFRAFGEEGDDASISRASAPLLSMLVRDPPADGDLGIDDDDDDDDVDDGSDLDGNGPGDEMEENASQIGVPKSAQRDKPSVAPMPSELQDAVAIVAARSAAFKKKKEKREQEQQRALAQQREEERQRQAAIDEDLLEALDDEAEEDVDDAEEVRSEGEGSVREEDAVELESLRDDAVAPRAPASLDPPDAQDDAIRDSHNSDDQFEDSDEISPKEAAPPSEGDTAQTPPPFGSDEENDAATLPKEVDAPGLDEACSEDSPRKSAQGGSGGNGGDGGERDVLEEFSLWLGLIKDRFHGPASTKREAEVDPAIGAARSPLEHGEDENSPSYRALAKPTFREGLSTAGRLSEMRRRAEDIAVRAASRHALMQDESKARMVASKVASFVQVLRLRAAASVDGQTADNFSENADSHEDDSALFIARSIVRTGSWEPLLSAFEVDLRDPNDAAEKADQSFSSVLDRQSKARKSLNGELVRQYLNVVLRGLPASPALADMVRRIPSQNVALSYTNTPECAYKLGRVTAQFRRIFCDMYEGLFMPPLPSPAASRAGPARDDAQLEAAVEDLCQFMSLMVRVIAWYYPELLVCNVREVMGDTSKGRVQDSRRGGWIPRSTKNPMLIVRSCVEDAVLDPLLDNLYLAYNGVCGERDARVGDACRTLTRSLSEPELMAACGVPPFYQLEHAHPVARPAAYRRSLKNGPAPASPYQSAIDLMVSAWINARTPASKISVLSLAHQAIVDAAILHYSRPTEMRDEDGNVQVRAAIKEQRKLVPRRREMLAIFTHCMIMSLPPNLETQSRLLFDLGSRHAVAHSEVAAHAIAMLCMMPRSVEAVAAAAAASPAL